jgi:quinone-modifying oxidoreductase, subunit QmoC
MEFVEVANVNDVDDGQMIGFVVDERRILLAKVDGEFFAIGATCSHERSNLDQGSLLGHVVYCPLHFSAFDVRSGAVLGPPAECPVPAHEVRVEDGKVLVSAQPVDTAAPPADAAPLQADAAPVQADAAPVQADAAPVQADAAPVQADAAPVQADAAPVQADAAPVQADAGAPLDTSTRERVELLLDRIQSDLNELRAIVMGEAPLDSGKPPLDLEGPPPDSGGPPLDSGGPALDPEAAPLKTGAPLPGAARASKAEPQPLAGAWSLQGPRFMGRIPTSARYLPLAIAIPAVLVALLVTASVTLKDGPAVPDGDILFEHFIGHGWLDIFTLPLVGVVGLVAAMGVRRFWKGLQATLPPGMPLRPLGEALQGTAREVVAHEDFHDWTTSDVRRGSHLAMFYGFLGLMAATTGAALYTEIFPILGIEWHNNQLSLPIWDPVKIVGNVGGIALLIGLAQTLSTWCRRPQTASRATYADWFFPGSLALAAVTGFLTEILRFSGVRMAYPVYVVHLVCVFALFVLFPFSKFAHVIYHPAARTFGRQLRKRKPATTLARTASSLDSDAASVV